MINCVYHTDLTGRGSKGASGSYPWHEIPVTGHQNQTAGKAAIYPTAIVIIVNQAILEQLSNRNMIILNCYQLINWIYTTSYK